MIYCIYTVYKL